MTRGSFFTEAVAVSQTLGRLVELQVASLGPCPAPEPSLVVPKKLPVTLKSKQRLTLGYTLSFDCANDPAKKTRNDGGHEDFALDGRVDHTALGVADDHPVDDVCPRSVAPPYELEPYPDGKIKERDCGETKPDKTLGAPAVVDVVVG